MLHSRRFVLRLFVLAAPLLLVGLAFNATLAVDPPKQDPPKPATWTTGKITGSPEPPPAYATPRAYSNVKFRRPLLYARAPGLDRFFIAEHEGKVYSVLNKEDVKPELFLEGADLKNIKTLKDSNGFETVYGLVFHPNFEKNRECFVCYTIKPKQGIKNLTDGTRVSRFKVNVPKDGPPRIDAESEEIVITFLQGGHNGGDLHFGKDGMLYISTGDAADPNPPDPLKTGQDCSDLLSSILRIDINKKDEGKNYAVPKDNPFVGVVHDGKPVRPEIWSFGFRNPWRMSFDRKTGDLWVGDVGWEAWEMVYKIEKGGNYGWSVMEARQPINTKLTVGPSPILPPTIELDHSQAASVTGGYVYRGKKHPDLVGKYIFGDYMTKRIWAATVKDGRVSELVDICAPTVRIVAFGEDGDGEIFLLDYDTGLIHSLEKNDKPSYDPKKFPRTLSQTGLYANVRDHKLAEGVHKFEVNAPMWSDGATAERFVALPNGQPIKEHEQRKQLGGTIDWLPYSLHPPKDAVLGKTLTLKLNANDTRRIETQILHYDGNYWQAYSYMWREDQSEADLVPIDGAEKYFMVDDRRVLGGKREQRWNFASRAQCLQCHTPWAETTLAFNTLQLNRVGEIGGVQKNQLAALCDLGLLQRVKNDGKPNTAYDATNTAKVKQLANPYDLKAKLEDRARSYLHVNCSHCHRNGGGGAVSFELKYDSDLKKGVWDAAPTRGDFGIKDAKIISPGNPHQSTLFFRMVKFGKDRMPHIGSELPDHEALRILSLWITGKVEFQTVDVEDLAKRIQELDAALTLTKVLRKSTRCEEDILKAAAALPSGPVRDLFEGYFPPDGKPKKLGTLPRPRSILSLTGDAKRGQAIFHTEKMQCVKCHKFDGKGLEIGPDLTKIGKDRSREDLLESLLEPSRRVEAKYQMYTLCNLEGKSVSGLLVKRDDKETVLRDSENKEHRFAAKDIDTFKPSRNSLMPDGLLADLTAQEAADLLEFLKQAK